MIGMNRPCPAALADPRNNASPRPHGQRLLDPRTRTAARPGRALRRPRGRAARRSPGKRPACSRARCCARWATPGCSGLMYESALRRRRRRRADQPGLRRGAVAVDVRRLHHHRAGPHRHGEPAPAPCRHAGAEGAYMPGVVAGGTITAVGITEPGAGSDVAGIRTRAVRDGDALGAQRHQDLHHQRRPRRPVLRRREDRRRRDTASRCSSSRRARRASRSAAR